MTFQNQPSEAYLSPQEREELKRRFLQADAKIVRRDQRPETPQGLLDYCREHYGLTIPKQRICPDHNVPADYLIRKFFENPGKSWSANDLERWAPIGDVIVWACRNGLKTLLAGILSHLDCKFKPGCDVRILGGSLDQSKKAYKYFTDCCEKASPHELVGEPTERETKFINRSKTEVLTQSRKSVKGPHVPKVRCDEVEEFDEDVWGLVQFTTASRPGIKSSFESLSTAHSPYGRTIRLVDAAADSGQRVLKWCLWEVIEACPETADCDKCKGIKARDENQLVHTFFEICQGKAKLIREKRFPCITIEDAHKIFCRSSFEEYESNMLCRRPRQGGGRFYKEYDDRFPGGIHVIPDQYKSDWPTYEAYDGGYHHPRASVYQINPATDQRIKIDEWAPENLGTSDFVEGLDAWRKVQGYREPEIRVCDPAATDLIAEFKKGVPSKGIPGVDIKPANNDRKAGQAEIRRLLRINDRIGGPMFLVCQRCKVGRREMRELYYPQVSPDKPPAEDHVKMNDHGPDTDRYMMMALAKKGEMFVGRL